MNPTDQAAEGVITDCLKTLSLDGRIVAMDEDGLCVMEIDDFRLVEGNSWSSFWPDESRPLVEEAVGRAASGKVARFHADCPTAKGSLKSWEVSVAPIRDTDGNIVALQSLSQDVTRREREIRERVLVSGELAHRIKNLFSIVDSLVHLSSRSAPEARSFVEGFRQRLTGLSRAISFIQPMSDADATRAPRTVRALIAALVMPYEETGAHIVLAGDDAPINPEAVTSLAMVVNELATNAVKYGALKTGQGRLAITLTRVTDNLTFEWTETFARDCHEPIKPGFGTNLLDRTVRRQLSGTIHREWSPTGLIVRIGLPVSCLA